jgi:membrane protein GlpM
MDIVWKGVAGGLVTAAIVFLSRRGNTLPGILPLFPTFALIALLIVGAKTIPAYLAFLAVCYFAAGRVDYRIALLGGPAGWFIVALGVFLAPRWT